MAESVQLVLPDHDQERLDKLAAVRKEEAIWDTSENTSRASVNISAEMC